MSRGVRLAGVAVLVGAITAGLGWAAQVEGAALRTLALRGVEVDWSGYVWREGALRLRVWAGQGGLYAGHSGFDPWLPFGIAALLAGLGGGLAQIHRGRLLGRAVLAFAPLVAWIPTALAYRSYLASGGVNVERMYRLAWAGGPLPDRIGLRLVELHQTAGDLLPWQTVVAPLPGGHLVQSFLVLWLALGAVGLLAVVWLARAGARPSPSGVPLWGALLVAGAAPALVVAQTEQAQHVRFAEHSARTFQRAAAQEGPAAAWQRFTATLGPRWPALLTYRRASQSAPVKLSHNASPRDQLRRASPRTDPFLWCPEDTPQGLDVRASGVGPAREAFRLVVLRAQRPLLVALPLIALACAVLLLMVASRVRPRWARITLAWLALSLPTASAAVDLTQRDAAIAQMPRSSALERLSAPTEPPGCAVPLGTRLVDTPSKRLGLLAGWVILLGGIALLAGGRPRTQTRSTEP